MDVLVDENGDFLANLSGGADANIYEAEQPYGPFVCRRCGAEYEYLRITPYRPTGQQEAGTRKTKVQSINRIWPGKYLHRKIIKGQ